MGKQPKTMFKRSRGGCQTCRARKKKCDEQFDEVGHCQRCRTGGFTCTPMEPGTSLPKSTPRSSPSASPRPSSTTASSNLASTSAAQHNAPVSITTAPEPSLWNAFTSRPESMSGGSAFAPSHATGLGGGSYSALFASHPSPRPPPLPSLPSLSAPVSLPSSSLPLDSTVAWHSQLETPFDPLADIGYSSELLSFFESLNPAIDGATQDLFDPGNLFNDDLPQPPATTAPPDLPQLAAVAALAAEQTQQQDTGDVRAALNFKVSVDSASTTRRLPTPNPPSVPLAPLSDTASATEGDSRDHDEAAQVRPVYDQLNENFFASLPVPVREVVKRRMAEVAFSSELSKSACMAVCLLYRARMVEKVAPDARERLINRSNSYFLKAVEHLQTGEVPLEAQVLAVFDLQLFQLEQYGAAAGNAILLLGDYFVTEALGPRPKLDLQTLSGPASVMYRSFAYTDVLRCFALGDRKTLFALAGVPGEDTPAGDDSTGSGAASAVASPGVATQDTTAGATTRTPTDGATTGEGPGAVWARDREHNPWGLPPALLLVIAGIANLAQDAKHGLFLSTPSEFTRRRDALETAIRSWRPSADSPWPGSMPHGIEEAADDSIRTMEHMTTAEMWRHAALIYLYQALDHHGPLHPAIRRSVAQLLALGSRDAMAATSTLLSFHDGSAAAASSLASLSTAEKYKHVFNVTHNERAMQWFVCGTNCVSIQERELCRAGLRQTRPAVLAKGNLDVLERIWELTDERGWTVDWRQVLASEGRHIAFA